MSSKQDGVYTRTSAQLEQKINFGKSFAEVMGIATDARDSSEEAKNQVKNLDSSLTSEEIYNRLTNNGTLQGLFRDDNGNLFVNGAYIYALEALFAKDIDMSGKFTHKVMTFLEPTENEVATIQKHLAGTEYISADRLHLYDVNNSGTITVADMGTMQLCVSGLYSLSDWSGAVETEATLTVSLTNPNKFIRITGKNMWGSEIDKYIGVSFTNIQNPDYEKRLKALEEATFES